VQRDKLRIKQPTRYIKFPKLYFVIKLIHVSGIFCAHHQEFIYCTHGSWYVSCRLCDRFLAESGWNCESCSENRWRTAVNSRINVTIVTFVADSAAESGFVLPARTLILVAAQRSELLSCEQVVRFILLAAV
jgi:hypothetical protein